MANNEMKLGKNKVEFLGVVKEQNLEKVEKKDKDGNKYNAIQGKLTVKCGEFREVPIQVFTKELTSKGEVSKKYLTLCDFINKTLPTMASAKDEEKPTVVSLWGNDDFTPNFSENIYKNKQDEIVNKLQFNLGFGNVTVKDDYNEEDFKAEFEVEVYVNTVKEEIDKEGQPTGRYLIDTYLPLYGGTVAPVQFVAGKILDDNGEEFDMGEAVYDNIREGDTILLQGDINFEKKIIQTKVAGKGFGRAKIDSKTEYINELVITYCELVEDEDKQFLEEDIRQALVVRDGIIEEKKNEEKEEQTQERKRGMNATGRARRGF